LPCSVSVAAVGNPELERSLTRELPFLERYVRTRIPLRLRKVVAPEDVLQEVCVSAFHGRKAVRIRTKEGFARWLQKVADRKLIDLCRSAYAEKRGGPDAYNFDPLGAGSSLAHLCKRLLPSSRTPSREISAREAVHAVQLGLQELPEDIRQAIVLHEVEGRSLDDVAKFMDRSQAAVRGLLYRGRVRLRRFLGDPRRFLSGSMTTRLPEDSGAA
jgi:RNA polymerase sigma-70 factor (ECF subfamily)